MAQSTHEIIKFNLVLYVIAFFFLYFVEQLPEPMNTADMGSGYFPKLILWVIIIANTLQIIYKIFNKREKADNNRENVSYLRFAIILIASVGYVWSLDIIGYKIATFLFIIINLLLFNVKSWKALIITPLSIVLAIYIFFDLLLSIPLP